MANLCETPGTVGFLETQASLRAEASRERRFDSHATGLNYTAQSHATCFGSLNFTPVLPARFALPEEGGSAPLLGADSPALAR